MINIRCAFVKLAQPGKTLREGEFQYELTALIPKKAVKEFKHFQAILEEVIAQTTKFKTAKDKAAVLKLVRTTHIEKSLFKDGDKTVDGRGKVYDGLEGHYTVKIKTKAEEMSTGVFKSPQGLVLRYARTNEDIPLEEQADQLYSGAWYDVAVSLSAYDTLGTKGVTAYLQGVSKLVNDTRLGGADPFSEARDDLPEEEEYEEADEY